MDTKKISVHAVGMAVAAVVVWVLGMWVAIPAPIAVAFGTIAAAVVKWIVPDEMEAE